MLNYFKLKKKTGCVVRNLEVKTVCRNVLQPHLNFPSSGESPAGSTLRAGSYVQLPKPLALRPAARNQSTSFPFLLFPQPHLFPCCPPESCYLGVTCFGQEVSIVKRNTPRFINEALAALPSAAGCSVWRKHSIFKEIHDTRWKGAFSTLRNRPK